MGNMQMDSSLKDIAIIGMSGRFPKAKDLDKYWQNVREGVECISFFSDSELVYSGIDPALVSRPDYIKAYAVIEDIELFDASFFGFTPKDAEITDPQQRLFLECAQEAIENAGYVPENYAGFIGVYAGASSSSYLTKNILPNLALIDTVGDFKIAIANDKDYLATRLSYKLDLKGPSINIQTACSTSLVAIVCACQSLLSYQCDIAVAGGVSLSVPQKKGYLYKEGSINSPDGHCRAFDAKAGGTVGGNGLGVVILKRLAEALSDGDRIRAVIKGSAVNNDGAMKVGYTAPSVDGQAEVIAMAHAMAGVEAQTIGYVETHGTGTPLGDPIEIAALTKAFRYVTDKSGFCAIGSVKTNIGHLDAAAGVAGVIKTVLALENKQLPPSLHFDNPNPEVDWNNSPFYVNTKLSEWQAGESPRRAGVSSFGIGGTNAHVILEEAPVLDPSSPSRLFQLLVLSAKTDSALAAVTKNLSAHLRENPNLDLSDVAYTLQIGRRRLKNRRIVVCRDNNDAVISLGTSDSQKAYSAIDESTGRPIVFMLSGQGSQYVNMALELYQTEATFRDQVDLCAGLLKPDLGCDLRDVLYPDAKNIETASHKLAQTSITQPALFVIEYSFAKLLEEWGIRPQAMIGHSIGEYVAACLAGVFTLQEALKLVAMRGRLIQTLPGGAMLTVALPEKEVSSLLGESLSIAAVNGPSSCVISGPEGTVVALEKTLTELKAVFRRLHTSHAFHSKMMDPILPLFFEQIKKIKLKNPKIRYISNVTGTWITTGQATDPAYWVSHLRKTVRFSDGVAELLKDKKLICLEVGPGRTLATLVKQVVNNTPDLQALSTLRHPKEQESDVAFMLKTIGRLWISGVDIDWGGFYKKERRNRVPLPSYPFERQRYWIETVAQSGKEMANVLQSTKNEDQASEYARPDLSIAYTAPRNKTEEDIAGIWSSILGIRDVGVFDNYFDLGGDSLSASQVVSRMREMFKVEILIDKFFEDASVSAHAEIVKKAQWLKQKPENGQKGKKAGYMEI